MIERLSEGAGGAALVLVTETHGSSPRHPGSRMAVFPDGAFLGTVGGGIVEATAIRKAMEAAETATPLSFTVRMTGERALGSESICGGVVTMAVCPVLDPAAYAAASRRLKEGGRIALVHALSPEAAARSGATRVAHADGTLVHGAEPGLDPAALRAAIESRAPVVSALDGCLYDPVDPMDRLLILGAGHVGRALARMAAGLDFGVCVGDFRPELLDPAAFPDGTELRLGQFSEIIRAYPFGPSTYAVAIGPGHSSDLECVRAILAREYRYAGFIGSKRKARMIMDQAIAEGFPADKVSGLKAPIGMDIGAETPAEIAVAILAQIIAVRRNSPAAASA